MQLRIVKHSHPDGGWLVEHPTPRIVIGSGETPLRALLRTQMEIKRELDRLLVKIGSDGMPKDRGATVIE